MQTQITITHCPLFDIYLASIPRINAVTLECNSQGKIAINGDDVAWTHTHKFTAMHVLAVGSSAAHAETLAKIKLTRK